MKIISFENNQVLLMVGVVFLLAVFLLSVFVFAPLMVNVNSMRREYWDMEQEMAIVRDLMVSNNDIERRLQLLGPEKVSSAIKEMTAVGKGLEIKFSSISLLDKERVEGRSYELLPISINLQARYKDLGVFLDTLKRFKNSIITVRSLKVSRDEEILPLIDAKLVLDLYIKESKSE